MDVRIGVTYSGKELEVELADDADREAIKASVQDAIADDKTLWLEDKKGREVGVPAEKIAFVEIGSPDEDQRIGFGA